MRLSIVVRLVGILTFLALACSIPRAGFPTVSAAATPLLAADSIDDEVPPPPDPAPFSDLRTVDNRLPVVQDAANAVQSANLSPQLMTDLWVAQGPGPSRYGQIENVTPDNAVVGALHTVLAHPTDPNILYAGGANGGVWRTVNATAASPNWVALTDYHPSLSIGALAFDRTDATWQTLVAGIGRFSSFGRTGGARTGLLRTTDGGDTWSELDGGGVLSGKNISGVAVRGSTIVVSVNTADSFTCSNIGIYRSTDGGLSFAPVTTGIPQAVAYDLIVDPTDSQILLASIVTLDVCAGSDGIYRSTDTGATWQKVSNSAIENLITNVTSNLELAAGPSGAVFAAVINQGIVVGIFRTPDASTSSWVQLDTPLTNEGGTLIGLNPNPNGKGGGAGDPPEMIAGGQGAIHFSMSVDPSNNNLVYVGGDRQPLEYSYPTATGAFDYSGRLFRGNASNSAGTQFVHLTHRNDVVALPGGGTANSSAPHADSRDMAIDANGNLIEVDDGGIYRRTSPQNNQGDWFSINGDIQVAEMHDVAYDATSNIIISGNQDTGTTQQTAPGSATWDSVSTADGGDVAVDTISLAGMNRSIRYSSYQNLGGFRRRVYDAGNNLISENFPALTPQNGSVTRQFVTPVVLNAVTPSRLVIGGGNGIGESMDSGATLTKLSPSIAVNYFAGKPLAYGGWRNGVSNPDVLYAGSSNNVYVRTAPGGSVALTAAAFPGAQSISDIVLDSEDWMTAFVSEQNQVFMTPDAGASWIEITGNLDDPDLHALDFMSGTPDILFAAGRNGVYFMKGTQPGVWEELGDNLPNAPVWDLDYDATDDVLVAGTLGRGAWKIANVKSVLQPAQIVLQKQVVNMSGGTLTANDFQLLLDGNPVAHNAISGVVSGTHTISEVQQAPYVLESVSCVSDQNAPVATTANQSGGYDLDVVSGHVVTCTLTNNDSAKITIIKDAEPASATNFRFTTAAISGGSGDSGSSIADFYLDDAAPDDGDAITSSKSFTVPHGAVYSFAEPAVSGWYLAAITCTPAGSATVNLATRSVTIDTSSSSHVTCTFKNEKAAALTVRKYRESNGIAGQQAPEAFLSAWTIQVKSSPTGTLISQAATNALGKVSFSLKPGSYQVCELQKNGWTQKVPAGNACHALTLAPASATQVDFGNCLNSSCPAMAAEVGGVDAPVAPVVFPVAADDLDGWLEQWLLTPDGPVEGTGEPDAGEGTLRLFLPVVVK